MVADVNLLRQTHCCRRPYEDATRHSRQEESRGVEIRDETLVGAAIYNGRKNG